MDETETYRQEAIDRLMEQAQDAAAAYIRDGTPIPTTVMDMITVCFEAMNARDLFGRRYFDIAMQREG